MTGVKRTIATAALEALLSIPPLDLFIKSTAYNASVDVRCNGWWSSVPMVRHSSVVDLIENDCLLMPSDQIRTVCLLDDKFEWSIPKEEDWLNERVVYPPSDSITCFTDGSKKDGLGRLFL